MGAFWFFIIGGLRGFTMLTRYVAPSTVSLFFLLLLISSVLINSTLTPKIYDFKFSSVDGTSVPLTPISLPHRTRSTENVHDYKFEGKIDYLPFQTTRFRISADNCVRGLKVNGKDVPLEGNYTGDLCKYDTGAIFDLKDYLRAGANNIEVVTWDDAMAIGNYSFNLQLVM